MKILILLVVYLYSTHSMAQYNPLGDTSCGQLGQKACNMFSEEYWESAECDQGLVKKFDWNEVSSFCEIGSRNQGNFSPWLIETLQYQRDLKKNDSLVHSQFIAPMNEQKFSISDLLEMGVRAFHLKVDSVDNILRICDSTPCKDRSRYLAFLLEELKIWLKGHPQEVLLLSFVDSFSESLDDDFNKIIKFHLGDLLANNLIQDSTIASSQSILNSKKQVLIFTHQKERLDEGIKISLFFESYFGPSKNFNDLKYFDSSTCNFTKNNESAFLFPLDSKFRKSIKKWMFLSEENTIIPLEKIRELTNCGLGVLGFNHIDQTHLANTIWSWDTNHPFKWGLGNDCAMISENGRWVSTDCSEKHYFACKNEINSFEWTITQKSDVFSKGSSLCPSGYKFLKPFSALENSFLFKKMKTQGIKDVYINEKFDKGEISQWDSIKFLPLGGKDPVFMISPKVNNYFLTEFLYNDVRQYVNLAIFPSWQVRQLWEFKKDKDNRFKISSKFSKNCLSADKRVDGSIVKTETCDQSADQLWQLIPIGNDRYQIKLNSSNLCLDIYREKDRIFNPMMVWNCHNVDSHTFELRRVWSL